MTDVTWSDSAFASKPWILRAWRPQLPIKAGGAPSAWVDCFALALAHHRRYTLLTEDRRMRSFALEEGIQHHDLLWIIDQMHRATILTRSQVAAALEAMRADPRRPVPDQELARRLRSLTG